MRPSRTNCWSARSLGPFRVRVAVLLISFVAGGVVWAELMHARASGRRLGTPRTAVGREVVIVLGFRNRGTRANYLNRYRVRVALRSVDPAAIDSVILFCGGCVAGELSEAELMARYARDECGYAGSVLLDRDSETTWQNMENAAALIDEFDTIKIASNSLHAEKARAYLWKQRPDLAVRLAPAEDYRFGEILFVKPLAALLRVKNPQRLST